MSNAPADRDDAGIFALVVLATIVVGAGLVAVDLTLWLLIPTFGLFAVLGEVAARKLAALKDRQLVERETP